MCPELQFILLYSLYCFMCVCARACMCMCTCVWERTCVCDRETDWQRQGVTLIPDLWQLRSMMLGTYVVPLRCFIQKVTVSKGYCQGLQTHFSCRSVVPLVRIGRWSLLWKVALENLSPLWASTVNFKYSQELPWFCPWSPWDLSFLYNLLHL